jgi:hypothetical protein
MVKGFEEAILKNAQRSVSALSSIASLHCQSKSVSTIASSSVLAYPAFDTYHVACSSMNMSYFSYLYP